MSGLPPLPPSVADENTYVFLPDALEVWCPARVTKKFHIGEKGGLVSKLRPDVAAAAETGQDDARSPPEASRAIRRLSSFGRKLHRTSVTTHELSEQDSKQVLRMDVQSLLPIENMVDLVELNEASLLHNLRLRFYRKSVFTWIGSILVSVNPFEPLPLFTPTVMDTYKKSTAEQRKKGLPPHIYTVAHEAYEDLILNRKNQALIVTGESGAGKTELAKNFISYALEVARQSEDEPQLSRESAPLSPQNTRGERASSSFHVGASLQSKILGLTPLIEAFGNAKTTRNDNSSRHGKWIALQVNTKTGVVMGASVMVVLLEKSRLVHQGKSERNFHVMYQLLASAEQDSYLRDALQLHEASSPESFHYLSGNRASLEKRDGVRRRGENEDARAFAETLRALRDMGVSKEKEGEILQVLAALLHLGNIRFTTSAKDPDAATIENHDVLNVAAELLGVHSSELEKALISKDLSNSVEQVFQKRSIVSAEEARDTLAKHVYSKLFDWIAACINKALGYSAQVKGATMNTLGVLDVFGFESFEVNSFEQLCINYANEALQRQFHRHVFEAEKASYRQQGINDRLINELFDSTTNANTITLMSLFESKPSGVFALLDDEIAVPKGSDQGFLNKLISVSAPSGLITRATGSSNAFTIVHYAGPVTYSVEGFLFKSKDRMDPALERLLSGRNKSEGSVVDLVLEIMNLSLDAGPSLAINPAPRKSLVAGGLTGGGGKSLGTKFVAQLGELLTSLDTTKLHYARALKPNDEKSSSSFASAMVMSQLRCAGVLDVCRVRAKGFPVRIGFEDFCWRYARLIPHFSPANPSGKDCQRILETVDVANKDDVVVGNTMVLMRTKVYDVLETRRSESLRGSATAIQKLARGRQVRVSVMEARSRVDELSKLSVSANDLLSVSGTPIEKFQALAIALRAARLGSELVPNHHAAMSASSKALERVESRVAAIELVVNATNYQEAKLAMTEAAAANVSEASCPEAWRKCQTFIHQAEDAKAIKESLRAAMAKRNLDALVKLIAQAEAVGLETSEAKALVERLHAESRAIKALEASVAASSIEEIKSGLKVMETLGLESHPVALNASKVLSKAKHKRTQSRDVVLATRNEEVAEALRRLKNAESSRDLGALSRARQEAMELGLDSHAEVKRSLQLMKDLEDKNDSRVMLEAAMFALRSKAESRSAATSLSVKDIERLIECIQVAKQRGNGAAQEEILHEAYDLERRCRAQCKAQASLGLNLKDRNFDKLRDALSEAEAMGLDNDLVRRAKALVSRKDGRTKEETAARRALELRKMARRGDFQANKRVERLRTARDVRHWIGNYPSLRTEEDYARKPGLIFSGIDKQVAKGRLRWTGEIIPKSITEQAGADERLARRAVLMSKAILGFCGDLSLPYPSVLVQQIFEAAFLDPPLADEMWVQLIRQLTGNPIPDSKRRAWQLFAMAASTIGPSDPRLEDCVLHFLLGSIAQIAARNDPEESVLREYARFSQRRFEQLLEHGSSGAILTRKEIDAFRERMPAMATIILPDGAEVVTDFPVAPDVTIGEVVTAVCTEMGLKPDYIPFFGLFTELQDHDPTARRTRTLKRKDAAAVVGGVAPNPSAAAQGDRAPMPTQLGHGLTAPLPKGPKPTAMRAASSFSAAIPPTKSKLNVLNMPDPSPEPMSALDFLGQALELHVKNGRRPTFVLRRMFCPERGRDPPGSGKDKVYTNLAYHEAVEEVLSSRWPIESIQTVAELAALIMLDAAGKPPSDVAKSAQVIEEFLPRDWLGAPEDSERALSATQWAQHVVAASKRLGVSKPGHDAKRAFLSLTETSHAYGLVLFNVRQSGMNCVFGLGGGGLYLFEEDEHVPAVPRELLWHAIHRHVKKLNGFSGSFAIDVWDKTETTSTRHSFITSQSNDITALIWDYGVRFSETKPAPKS